MHGQMTVVIEEKPAWMPELFATGGTRQMSGLMETMAPCLAGNINMSTVNLCLERQTEGWD